MTAFIHVYPGCCRRLFKDLARIYPDRRIVIVTDPPYNQRFRGYDLYQDCLDDEDYIDLIGMFRGLPAAFIHYPEGMARWLVPALGVMQRSAFWCYHYTAPRCTRQIGFFNIEPDFEQVRCPFRDAVYAKKMAQKGRFDRFVSNWWDDIDLLKQNDPERKGSPHPCPVPVRLMERILALCAHKGDLVCDPFAGTLTTAIAAHRLGLDFIGIELSQKYIDFGVNRIQREFGLMPEIFDGEQILGKVA